MSARRSPEGDLQRNIIELAEMLGYRCYHVAKVKGHLRARTSLGFPDLVMVKAPRLIFAELKAPGKYLTPEQKAWKQSSTRSRRRRFMGHGGPTTGITLLQHFKGGRHD